MDDKHKQSWDYSQITEYIFLGSDMFDGGDHYDFLVNKMDIKADVAVMNEKFELPSKLMEEFLWLNVVDQTAPTMTQLDVGVNFIKALVKSKKRVFVHCRLGHGRSPTLVAAYLKSTGLSTEEAIKKIKEARPEIHLEEGQRVALEEYGS